MNYNYPLEQDWSIEETLKVVSFYNAIEKAYEQGIDKTELMEAYRGFSEVVMMKSEQRKLQKAFAEVSGYDAYEVLQKAKTQTLIRMKDAS